MNKGLNGQIDFYNHRWIEFAYANANKLTRCPAILDAIRLTKLNVPCILDLGCGTGWLSAIIGLFGPTIGVGLSDVAIKFAKVRFPHMQYRQANIFEWQVPKEAFDIVVSQEVIEHVENQAGYLQVAYEALHPKGYLILTTPKKKTMLAMPDEQRENWSGQPIENWLSIKELTSLIARGFSILQVRTVIPGLGHKGSYRFFNSTRLEKIIEQIGAEQAYDRLRSALGLGLHIVVIARKRVMWTNQ